MNVPLRIVYSPRGAELMEIADAWWRENRQAAPALLRNEVASALSSLAAMPNLGTIAPANVAADTRRILLPRTRHHLYYRATADAIIVLAVWHSVRGEGPQL